MSTCSRVDEIRDYAMGEGPAEARGAIENHAASCEECAGELQRMRLVTAALRSMPEEEVPQRIAFVSDKIFEPSPVTRFFQGFWNSTARLGFASACLLTVAITTFALRQPAAAPVAPSPAAANATATQASYTPALSQREIARQIDEAVAKAVTQVREQDARLTKAALESAEARHQKEHQALMVAMQESMTVLQKRLSTYTMLASNYQPREAAGQ